MFQNFNVGVKGVVVKNNKVLLLKRKSSYKNNYFWDLPGGRINNKGTIIPTLIREIKEELGVTPKKIGKIINVGIDTDYSMYAKNTFLIILFYLIEVPHLNFKLSKEHELVRWTGKKDINKLPKDIFLPIHTKEIIQNL